ncbi:MAG: DNA polymerase II [Desulfuromonadales bacterium]|nr:DNA polymerase II [Desulfuromonadales bacterium]NIR33031.1 DNA polymerase II [Desulfuromonadales bacterium]NIS39274.1 DNA polymerase II [Desulfuromonadales bacterium]
MAKQSSEEKRSMEVAEEAREKEWQKPSLVGELFMGRLRTELVFPFPEQDPEDRAQGDEKLAEVRDFLEKKVDADKIDETKNIPKSVFTGLAKMGLFGIKIPKEFGGLGMSQVNYNRIIHLVASHCANTAVMLSAHQSIGVPQPLRMFGTEEQKKKYLPRLAKGEVSAFALTEPDVGSDPASMKTTAVPTEDGEGYVINGEKLWISNGPIADILIVMARTNAPEEDRPEITAFIVERDAEGFSSEFRCDFMGLKGINNGLLKFENVVVPKENIVHEKGKGLGLALRTLNTGRLTLPAACGGSMKQALAMIRQWANEREQWGAPVGHHEAVASKVARITADIYAVESLTWLTSILADREEQDIRLEAAMAKMFCTEALWRCVDEALQVRGGRGYETAQSLKGRGELPIPMERLMRDARINLIIEGTSEIMRLFIAREALDPHLKAAGMSATSQKMDIVGATKFYAGWYPKLWLPRFGSPDGISLPSPLAGHLRFVERASRRLARDLFHMMARYQAGLQRKQQVLGRLVDSGAELFAMTAVLARATSSGAEPGSDKVADLFCRQARRRLKDLHRGVYCNDDAAAYKLARKTLDGDFPWLEDNIVSTWKGSDNQ